MVEIIAGESVCVADATTRSSQQPAMPTAKPFFGALVIWKSVCHKTAFVSACVS